MNLFIFHKDLDISAKWFFKYSFKRANKQILESTQQISISCDVLGLLVPIKADGNRYKTNRYKSHPLTKWTYNTKDNFQFHINYVWSLLKEYTRLTNTIHACQKSLESVNLFPDNSVFVTPKFYGNPQYNHAIITYSDNDDTYKKYAYYIINKFILQDKNNNTKFLKDAYREWRTLYNGENKIL